MSIQQLQANSAASKICNIADNATEPTQLAGARPSLNAVAPTSFLPPGTSDTPSSLPYSQRFLSLLSGLCEPMPSFEKLEHTFNTASASGDAQGADQQQAFTEHAHQLSRHLAMLHLSGKDQPAIRGEIAEYSKQASQSIYRSLVDALDTLKKRAATLGPSEVDTVQKAITTLQQSLKQLDTVLRHAQLDAYIDELNNAHQSLGLKGWAGPILAASIPQFVSSLTHLGYVRSATGEATSKLFSGVRWRELVGGSTLTGATAGIAHEGVNSVVKPVFQAIFHATTLAQKADMVSLKPVPGDRVIPDPLPFKNSDGALKNKPPEELARELDRIKAQRERLSHKRALGTTTHIAGEAVPYAMFGGAHAIRQILNDLTSINGTTIDAKALASGAAGAVTAGAHTAIQLGTTFTDAQGRSFPVYQLDRPPKSLSAELAKGLDLRKTTVRSAFTSKLFSGIQSATLSAVLPPASVAKRPSIANVGPSPLTTLQIVGNALLAAAGSVCYLSTLYSSQAIAGENAARRNVSDVSPVMFDRTQTAIQNILRPGRTDLPHLTSRTTLRGIPHQLENVTHVARGALQVVPQTMTDLTNAATALMINCAYSLGETVNSRLGNSSTLSSEPGSPGASTIAEETRRMSDMETGLSRSPNSCNALD